MTILAREGRAIITYTVVNIRVGDSFNITFPYLEDDESVLVSVRDDNGVKHTLVLDVDYSILNSTGGNGIYGTCVFLVERNNLNKLIIERELDVSQEMIFSSQTQFSKSTEDSLDKLTMLVQDTNYKEHLLRIPSDEVVPTGYMELPTAGERAGKVLAFDSMGKPIADKTAGGARALRQGMGEDEDPTFILNLYERKNNAILFDDDGSVELTGKDKLLNSSIAGGNGIVSTTVDDITTISAKAGDNITVTANGINAPKATTSTLGVVKGGTNTSIGSGGEVNAIDTKYTASNGLQLNGTAFSVKVKANLLAESDGLSAPKATNSTLGVVKAGQNVNIDADGKINTNDTTYTSGNGINVSSGVISAVAGSNVVVDADGIKVLNATDSRLGVVKAGLNVHINTSTGALHADIPLVGKGLEKEGLVFHVKPKTDGNITSDFDGVAVPIATTSVKGVMQVGSGLSVTDGIVSASPTGSITYPFTLDKDDWTLMADKVSLVNPRVPWINGLIHIGKDSIAVGAYGWIVVKTGSVWERLPAIVSTDLKSIAYGKDIIVVVGSNGVILSGTDIRSLSRVTSNTTVNLNGVCWTGTKFVAVGEGGFIANSPDGEIWTIRTSGTSESFYRVAQTSLGTVVVGSGGYIGLSTNHGDTLTAKTSGTSASLFGVCQGASDIIIVGATGTILTTGDLTTFSIKASGTTNALHDVFYADSKLAAVGVGASLLYSSDQNTWSKETYASSLGFYAVMYAENRWICAGSQDICSTSSLGVSLTAEEPMSKLDIFDSAYGNGMYVSLQGTGKLLITTNKRNYAVVQTPASHSLSSIAYGDGVFVIGLFNGHYGGLLVGVDVMNLTSVSSGLGSESLSGAAYCSKTSNFILVSSAGKCITSATPAVSASWVATTISSGVGLNGVAVDDNGFCVAVGDGGKVFTNTNILNSSTWVERTTGTATNISDVAIGKNTIVAIGGSGLILTASKADPSVWTVRASAGSNLNSIKYFNGIFVAVGNNGTVKVSDEDGATWITQPAITSYNLSGIILKDNYIFLQGGVGTILEGFTFAKQEISLPGVTSADVGIADVILTDDLTTAASEKAEWAKVDMIDTGTDKIVVTCLEEIPTINLSCQLKV